MSTLILIVDDEASNRQTLSRVLRREGYDVIEASNGQQALQRLAQSPVLMISDIQMPKLNGIELLKASRTHHPDTEVILMTAYGTIDTAVEAMKLGAWDFITKPIKRAELLRAVRRAIEKYALSKENRELKDALSRTLPRDWIGNSPTMRRLIIQAKQAADSQASILLLGESGTGKSRLAQKIHKLSPRKNGKLITLNCGAIPETLLESELFGHEAGAFTGAQKQRLGRFELANGGTLFLDEFTEMSTHLQVKLLRVLQEGEFERVGGSTTLRADVRIIAASNRSPRQAIEENRLREDLYYRLNVIQLKLPPLRERKEDIPALSRHFASIHAERNKRPFKEVHPEAMDVLCNWHWPGNVRELENTIERAVVLSQSNLIEKIDLPSEMLEQKEMQGKKLVFALGTPLKTIERIVIQETLSMVGGDKNRAADLLGITARTIYRREADWRDA
ncbi:MAG: sigma-54 dependent transcriptional regulator [Myxococcota bacterium]|nr:sigma-54 dependent transcriptional regulator [Myxococcota bacterium]